jgi:hypothetical protein
VIGHQAVGAQIEGTPGFLALQKEQKLKIVIVRSELCACDYSRGL